MNAGSANVARASASGSRWCRSRITCANDVEAGEIERAERGALRPADRRSGDLVDLFDRVGAALEGWRECARTPYSAR